MTNPQESRTPTTKSSAKNLKFEVENRNLTESKFTPERNEDESQYIIDPTRLYSIITAKAKTFLLLDARPSADYKASHIKHPSSINVPGEALSKGITVKSIERQLLIEYRGQWGRRSGNDMLILYDWFSDEFVPNTPLTGIKY